MAGLAWHNFTSAAVGIGVALALARGLTRRPGPDGAKHARQLLGRSDARHPLRAPAAVARLRAVPGLAGRDPEPRRLQRGHHARGRQAAASRCGPVASQEAIKELGTNGGGFFNANSAHPFENPTPLTNLIEMFLIFAIPAGLDLHLRADGARTSGRAGRCSPPWRCSSSPASAVCYWAEAHGNAALHGLADGAAARQHGGQGGALRHRRLGALRHRHHRRLVRRGQRHARQLHAARAAWCRWSTSSSARSSSAASAPGLYGMLVFVVLAVFIAGLMVGRTPEYLGKKIEQQRDEAGDALRPHLPAAHPRLLRLGGGGDPTASRR